MKRYSSKSIKGKLDKLVGDFFRSRPCDLKATDKRHICKGRREWTHIKTRLYLTTRWHFLNCLTLCSQAHFYFTNNPDRFVRWLDKYWPNRISELDKLLNPPKRITKKDLEVIYEELKQELAGELTEEPPENCGHVIIKRK